MSGTGLTRPSELTGAELQALVARASSLRERMAHPDAFNLAAAAASPKAAARLKRWREIVADGDDGWFRRRLSFDSLNEESVRGLLGDIARPEVFGLPAWTRVLVEVSREGEEHAHAAADGGGDEGQPFLQQDAPVPFEELLLPFLAVAERRLEEVAGGYRALPVQVRGGLERALLQNLSRICSRVLELEFRTFLACRQLDGLPYPEPARAHESRTAYLEFVDGIRGAGWWPLFREYCAMARVMAVVLLGWVANSAELLARLCADREDIAKTFFGGTDPGELAGLRMELSDAHDGGKSVVAIEFSCGARLIYKPKDLSLESSYFRLTAWLNALGATPSFPSLKIVEREGYGWEEFVDNRACDSEEQVRRFYRRSGALLCLIYAFNGLDFHFENLIACGEYPVPVDLETIYHHRAAKPADDPDLMDEALRRLRQSVLATHFLPNPAKANGRYYDISAIGRSAEENEFEGLRWRHINTDGLAYEYGNIKPERADNLPRFQGRNLSPDDNVGEIVDGFQDMYELLAAQTEQLLALESPFRQMFNHPARFILRGTFLYVSALNRACHPDCLREGIDFDIQLDVLSRQFVRAERRPDVWPLVREEVAAFWRADVPRFAARGDRDSLVLPSGETVEKCFTDSALNLSREKLVRFGEDDLRWQVGLIKGSIDARDAAWLTGYAPAEAEGWPPAEPLDRTELLAKAVAVARALEDSAIRRADGEPSWLVLKSLPWREQYALGAMEFDLYNGRCGLALFFAALEKVAPGRGFGETAGTSLASVHRWLAKANERDIASLGIGGLVGIPSLAYALANAGVLLDDVGLVEEAALVARRIRPELVAEDKALDFEGGAAGAILCLLACQRAGGDPGLLEIAVACGQHLLDARRPAVCGYRTWSTLGGKQLTGMSHGAAGIAYALTMLYRATDDRAFLEGAAEAVCFEDSEFSQVKNNWPDRRDLQRAGETPAEPGFMTRWCHGAPGIGLARIGGLPELDSPAIRRDITAALATTRNCGLLTRDHLCCGNMGLTETFLVAGQVLGDASWTQEALRIGSRVVARAERTGDLAITSRSGFRNPSLFHGAAGIGYQLLRLAYPAELPAVLLLA